MQEEKKGVVYKITYNDKIIYIGSTTDLKNRICSHKTFCYNQYDINKYIYNSRLYVYIRNNNIDFKDLKFEVVEEVNKTELKKVEGRYIRLHKDTILNHRVENRSIKEYHQDHKEELKEYAKEYHIKTYPQTREKQLEYKKEYYKQNRDRIIQRQKNYYHSHKEERAKYYEKNAEKAKEYQRNYRAEQKNK